MKRSLIKVAAVAVILAFGGVGLAHDALARGLFDRGHFGHGKRFANKVYDHDRRGYKSFRSPAWSCRCTELSCCDGD
jgi:hypothetical protein